MRQRDPASDLCRAVGTEREPPKTGAGQVPSKGREWFHEDQRAIKILRNVAAVQRNCNFPQFHITCEINNHTSATPSIITILIVLRGPSCIFRRVTKSLGRHPRWIPIYGI